MVNPLEEQHSLAADKERDQFQGHGKETYLGIVSGNTAPRVVVNCEGVWVDGKPLPLIVADKPVTVDSSGPVSEITLTLLTAGPVIVDRRLEHERSTNQLIVCNPTG